MNNRTFRIAWVDNSRSAVLTVIQAASAILLSDYCYCSNIVFDPNVSEDVFAHLAKGDTSDVRAAPVTVTLDAELELSQLNEYVRQRAAAVTSNEQADFQSIYPAPPADADTEIRVTVVVHRAETANRALLTSAQAVNQKRSCWLLIEYAHNGDETVVSITAVGSVSRQSEMPRILRSFEHIIRSVSNSPSTSLISTMLQTSPDDVLDIWNWNAGSVEAVKNCVHHLINQRVERQPDSQAICAWDGSLTYRQLDNLSSRLSHYLVDSFRKRSDDHDDHDQFVPLCFEKSMWTIVAILAVLKAGCAFVPLDSAHPSSRMKGIVRQVGARLILASSQNEEKCAQIADRVFVVNRDNVAKLAPQSDRTIKPIDLSASAYVLFTSGSTGTPKGVVIQHLQLSTHALCGGREIHFGQRSRMFQFASYTFDASIMEIITTLVHGGCVCVPSEWQRMNNIVRSMNMMRVNCAFFTPSLLMNLPLEELRHLELVIIGGEEIPLLLIETWRLKVRLILAYGPTECCVICLIHEAGPSTEIKRNTIGRAVGGKSWIVNRNNANILSPIGTVGELLIEGPILANGYLNDEAQTDAAFIQSPAWMPYEGRLYKTGDLVRYNYDGSIRFVGRKDTQVKLRGQRLELGEVEQQVRHSLLPLQVDVVAEIVVPSDEAGRDRFKSTSLVAFVCLSATNSKSKSRDDQDTTPRMAAISDQASPQILKMQSSELSPASETAIERLVETLKGIQHKLSQTLPSYMLPSIYVPLADMPLSVAGKTDRRKLREIALEALSLNGDIPDDTATGQPDLTYTEHLMQTLWAQALGLNAKDVGLGGNFFQLGGDSLTAMRLVTAARKTELLITIDDIFKNPTLSALSDVAVSKPYDRSYGSDLILPFSLLDPSILSKIRSEVALRCKMEMEAIEDIYPCTSSQEAMMASSIQIPGTYLMRYAFTLPSSVEVDRFKNAWQTVALHCTILRTRLVSTSTLSMVQAVVSDAIEWGQSDSDQETYQERDIDMEIGFGMPMARYTLSRNLRSGEIHFLWDVHHAILDGWSLPCILRNVDHAYFGAEVHPGPPFQRFAEHLLNIDHDASEAFWRAQLLDAPLPLFPALPSPTYRPRANARMERKVLFSRKPGSKITTATMIQAAWALVVAKYLSSTSNSEKGDVVFASTLSGRNADFPNIEDVKGPTITTIPFRIRFHDDELIIDYLRRIQNQLVATIPFEHFGLLKIMRMSAEARESCAFQNLLVIQPPTSATFPADKEVTLFGEGDCTPELLEFALTMECELDSDGVKLHSRYDSDVIDLVQMARLLEQFQHVLQQLTLEHEVAKLNEIEVVSPSDLSSILNWNSRRPEAYPESIQKQVYWQVRRQPALPAVCAWDGKLSYQHLQTLSSQLARHLRSLGVDSNVYVSICFEKSVWAVVSMLAVFIAGGACVPLDPGHPKQRLKIILDTSATQLIVCSIGNASLFEDFAGEVVVVDITFFKRRPDRDHMATVSRSQPSAVDPAYIIFTSGSSGMPKGIVIQHEALSTSIYNHGAVLGLDNKSRVLQFAAFTFDISFSDIFATLAFGGCVCIPSDHDRMNDLEGAIKSLDVNQACLTTAVAGQLRPEKVGNLKTLIIAGEAPTRDILSMWAEKVKLINMYGPAECTIYCAGKSNVQKHDCPENIGTGIGALLWITDVRDHNVLAPVGAVGELLVEGPLLARNYLNDDALTKAKFIENPTWTLKERHQSSHRRRLYKTGDLVRYDINGSIVFVGRKDKQVKVRGQRVELGEIEQQVRECTDSSFEIVVDMVNPKGHEKPALAAFVAVGDEIDVPQDATNIATTLDAKKRLRQIVQGLDSRLASRLPKYMIPSLFIPLWWIPISSSAKTDRQALQQMASTLPISELSAFQTSKSKECTPSKDAEKLMQELWQEVLDIETDTIGVDDNFFELGGDSLSAMSLVTAARGKDLSMTADGIFKHPTLSGMAKSIQPLEDDSGRAAAPFALLPDTVPIENFLSEASVKCNIDQDLVEDIYACTPCQDFFVDFATHYPGRGTLPNGYAGQTVYSVPSTVDLARLRAALDYVTSSCAILRTRIIQSSIGYLQVVTKCPLVWLEYEQFEKCMTDDRKNKMAFGDPLFRCYAVRGNEPDNRQFFVLTIHHALFDGWSLPLLMKDVADAYHEDKPPISEVKFNTFIKHLQDVDQEASDRFWHEELAGTEARPFCRVPRRLEPVIDAELTQEATIPASSSSGFTISTIVHAAWSFVIAQYTQGDEVVLDLARTGRSSSITGIERMIAPTVTHVPLRIYFDYCEKTQEFLRAVQKRTAAGIQHEQRGWKHIRRISGDTQAACDSATLLIVNPPTDKHDGTALLEMDIISQETLVDLPVPIKLMCTPTGSGVSTAVSFDTKFFKREGIEALLNQFGTVLQEMVFANEKHVLSDIKIGEAIASNLYNMPGGQESSE